MALASQGFHGPPGGTKLRCCIVSYSMREKVGTDLFLPPDLDAVAEAWLDLIRDTWYAKLTQRRRFKPLRLRDIRKDLKSHPIPSDRILKAFSDIPSSQPIHTRIVSAIVGVPQRSG